MGTRLNPRGPIKRATHERALHAENKIIFKDTFVIFKFLVTKYLFGDNFSPGPNLALLCHDMPHSNFSGVDNFVCFF